MKDLSLVRLIVEACSVRSTDFTGLHGKDEFTAAAAHVRNLIVDSIVLLRAGSHATSLFLAITGLEELSKAKLGMSRAADKNKSDVKRGKDPLFSHTDKHKLAFDPILLIGSRLAKSIGAHRVREIFSRYEDGTYSSLRERALYFSRDTEGLKLPSREISITLVTEHILIAIEAFDDYFDFMTQEASLMCEELNALYPSIEEVYGRSMGGDSNQIDSKA